jgi:hypothetical protein
MVLLCTWGPLAGVGGMPAIVAQALNVKGNWRGTALALISVPYWMLILSQVIWPIGGMSNFVFNLFALAVVTFIAESVLLLPAVRLGPVWIRLAIFVFVMLSTIPIHFAFPSMPD